MLVDASAGGSATPASRGPCFPPDPRDRGTARLELEFVDAATGEAVPNLAFAAYSEREGGRWLGFGVTDARGRACLEQLPEDLVEVETERSPPYAVSSAAAWVLADGTNSLRVEVALGGRVSGRVVDEAGAPLAGVPVRAPGIAPGPERLHLVEESDGPVLAVSDAAGRFELAALRSREFAVRFADGVVQRGRERQVALRFERGVDRIGRSLSIADGDEIDLGDLAFAALRRLRGRLTEAGGESIEGALVSANPQRAALRSGREFRVDPEHPATSWQPLRSDRFVLAAGEARSGKDGRFEVQIPERFGPHASWSGLWVETLDGRGELLHPDLPDDLEQDVVVSLSVRSVCFLELRDEHGTPVSFQAPAEGGAGRRPSIDRFDRPRNGGVVLARDDRGAWVPVHAGRDPDGRLRVPLPFPLESLAELRVEVDGYRPDSVTLPEGRRSGDSFACELRPMPCPVLRVRVRFDGEGTMGGLPLLVPLRASLLRERELGVPERFGSEVRVLADGAVHEVDLPIDTDRPAYVHLESSFLEIDGPTVFGPFSPHDEMPELPRLSVRAAAPRDPVRAPTNLDLFGPYAAPLEAVLRPEGREELERRLRDAPAGLRIELRDAVTREAIDASVALFLSDPEPGAASWFENPLLLKTRRGSLALPLPSGGSRLTIRPFGHRALSFDLDLRPGETKGLGTQFVEATELALDFVSSETFPASRVQSAVVHWGPGFPRSSWSFGVIDHERGRVLFDADARFVDGIVVGGEGEQIGGTLPLDRAFWFQELREEELGSPIHLPEIGRVDLRVDGCSPRDQHVPMNVELWPVVAFPVDFPILAIEVPADDSGERRFHVRAAVGRYEIVLRSALYELPPGVPRELVVEAGLGEVVLPVRERPN